MREQRDLFDLHEVLVEQLETIQPLLRDGGTGVVVSYVPHMRLNLVVFEVS